MRLSKPTCIRGSKGKAVSELASKISGLMIEIAERRHQVGYASGVCSFDCGLTPEPHRAGRANYLVHTADGSGDWGFIRSRWVQ